MSLKFTGSFGPITGAVTAGDTTPILPVITTPSIWTENNTGSGTTTTDYSIVTGNSLGSPLAMSHPISSGKYYWEFKYDSMAGGSFNGYFRCGVSSVAFPTNWLRWGGNSSPTWDVGDVIMCALDADQNFVHYGKNGVWEQDPTGGSGTAYVTGMTGPYGPGAYDGSSAHYYGLTLRSDPAQYHNLLLIPLDITTLMLYNVYIQLTNR
jgi:hypothetical protein